jgi:hypothetical protein
LGPCWQSDTRQPHTNTDANTVSSDTNPNSDADGNTNAVSTNTNADPNSGSVAITIAEYPSECEFDDADK